ncbi:MAG: hypothetical protein RL653_332 [Pseudomonadota bacterium]
MSTTSRTRWMGDMAGRALSVRRLEQDAQLRATLEAAGVSPSLLARADTDRDGRVDAGEAFKVADGFDRDGNPGTLVALSADGAPTAAGQALGVFREVFEVVEPVPEGPHFDGTALRLPPAFLARITSERGPEAALRFEAWAELVSSSAGLSARERIGRVNEFFHRHVAYTPDASSRVEDDRWQSPVETLARGGGDCEDFALAKAWTLRMLGFREDEVDVGLVRTRDGQMHAVALARDGQGAPWVLDNLEWEALRLGGRGDLKPIALVSPARIVALDAQWQPTGTPQPASSLSRFQRMLDETRGLLGP